jgi:CRP-like cAMP-binding protein
MVDAQVVRAQPNKEEAGGPWTPVSYRRNRLLAPLPEQAQEWLGPDHAELVDLTLREQVYEVDQPIDHVYFPLNCVVSEVTLLPDHGPIEVGTTGYEGMAGLPAFLGVTTSATRSFCQVPGQAVRLDLTALHRLSDSDGVLRGPLLRYTQAVMVELSQNVACNRLHSTEERCARWLLQTHDRVGGDVFPMTQDFLAQMLGVRRATVSLSARLLQEAGLIRYTRGRITVLDREGLHAASCTCYDAVRREFDKL